MQVRGRIRGEFFDRCPANGRIKSDAGSVSGWDGKDRTLENRNEEMLFKEPGTGNGIAWIPNYFTW